jgi:2,4-dienoyl-CoA reductase-like NADH-dependent reductase (Old Yellow Enzyme family)
MEEKDLIQNPPNLFEPFELRDVAFSNRIVVSPMCQYSSGDGYANEWHFVHLGSRAVGGAGLDEYRCLPGIRVRGQGSGSSLAF